MRAGLNKDTILQAAARMADTNGIASVTLKSLAEELGVKSPSLYKHISGGLEELNNELMLYGWRTLENEMMRSAVGKAKDEAVLSICHIYQDFVMCHRGMYEAMQWYNMYDSDEHLKATEGIVSVLFQVLEAYSLTEEQKVHIVRILRSFLHGFTVFESHDSFGNPVPVAETFDFALKTILNGIHDLQSGGTEK